MAIKIKLILKNPINRSTFKIRKSIFFQPFRLIVNKIFSYDLEPYKNESIYLYHYSKMLVTNQLKYSEEKVSKKLYYLANQLLNNFKILSVDFLSRLWKVLVHILNRSFMWNFSKRCRIYILNIMHSDI